MPLVGGIIAVLVAVIVVAVVAIPIVDDTTTSIINDDNANLETGITFDVNVSETESYEIEYSSGTLTINGTEVSIGITTPVPLFVTNTFSVWFDSDQSQPLYGAVSASQTTVTLSSATFTNGTYSSNATVGNDPSGSYTDVYLAFNPNGSGSYGIGVPSSESPIYANNGSTVYLMSVSSNNINTISYGTVPSSGTTLSSTPVWGLNASPPTLTATITAGNDYATITAASSNTSLIAPIQYLGNADNQTEATLLNVIPIMMILAIVIMAVGLIAYNRSDY